MTIPTTRDAILEALKQLPPDATLEDAMERLYFLSKLERGMAQSEARDLIPHEEVAKRFLK
jgi:predicted transcriptional regulator